MITIQLFKSEWYTFIVYFLFILSFVGISELLSKKLSVSGETTRQIVHIGVGFLVATSPFLFISPIPVIVLATLFIIVNSIGLKKDKFKGMHSTQRISYGTVFFPISFLILILIFWESDPTILIIGMLIMTISDPLASVIGKSINSKSTYIFWKDKKSIPGSISVFISSFLISCLGLYYLRILDLYQVPSITSLIITGIAVGTISFLSESISNSGSDNLSLPLLSALMLSIMQGLLIQDQIIVLLWILLSFILAFLAYKLKALTSGGAAGAMLLGSIVFSIGGIFWVIPMATFFILSSILSKIGKIKKTLLKGMVEKGSQRDILQVYANGGISLIMAIFFYFTSNPILYYMFLGSLAAATADTWGTEIGVFSKMKPRNILTLSHVEPGTSGGITLLGTAGVFAGSSVLTLSGVTFFDNSFLKIFIMIVISGILGAFIDSIIGATLQSQYKCPNCNKITEKHIHCKKYKTNLYSGIKWINNDLVNLCCTGSGALFVLLFYLIF